jgi:hypothetical protein
MAGHQHAQRRDELPGRPISHRLPDARKCPAHCATKLNVGWRSMTLKSFLRLELDGSIEP